jgi:hypothetical protein
MKVGNGIAGLPRNGARLLAFASMQFHKCKRSLINALFVSPKNGMPACLRPLPMLGIV